LLSLLVLTLCDSGTKHASLLFGQIASDMHSIEALEHCDDDDEDTIDIYQGCSEL